VLAVGCRVHPPRAGRPDLTAPVRYPWLLFDADDTLFDFRRAEVDALRDAFHDAGIPCEPAWYDAYRVVNARAWRELEAGRLSSARVRVVRFEHLFADIGCDLDPAAFAERYLHHLAIQATLVDGARELLDAVRATHHLAIVTNGLAEVQRPRLARSAIAPWIEHLVISEEIGVAKPHPAYFEAVFERIGRPPLGDVLVIGDSLSSDIAGGRAAGLDTCWYNPSGLARVDEPEPTYEIRRLAHLRAIVAG
jgi:2-haloacid dehalogenase